MNYCNETVLPRFSEYSLSSFMLRELRSDHAGETGAVYIYKGILAISRDAVVRTFADDHLATETQHLDFFNYWLPKSYHSKLILLWKLSGFLLGALSALMGRKTLFLTISAVETFVVEHYDKQISYLHAHGSSQERNLIAVLSKFQMDEDHHREDAKKRLMYTGPLAKLWCAFVGFGSELAVQVAKKI